MCWLLFPQHSNQAASSSRKSKLKWVIAGSKMVPLLSAPVFSSGTCHDLAQLGSTIVGKM